MRSSRANRGSQTNHSSNSSNSSSRRATRAQDTPRKSTPSASLSDGPEEKKETRRQRGRIVESEEVEKEKEKEIADIAEAEDGAEDVVRCLCGFEEYPGPPQLDDAHDVKQGIEDITSAVDDNELAGFFVQCDGCRVWQHGLCCGIQSEEQSPDEYFCELCKPELHKVFTAPNGQKYSHYVPLFQSLSRTTSRAASSPKDGRPSSSTTQSAKRRTTMNSRDAVYDEDEQLRRAIEASKGGEALESTDGGTRPAAKRGRSDSDTNDRKPEVSKRQRTASATPSPPRELRRFTSQAESEDGTTPRPIGAKKIRGAAARNHREKELREERERLRLEAKKKREGRAERRRIDDSDVGEDLPAELSSHNRSPEPQPPLEPPPSSHVSIPDTPPSAPPPTSHRKGGRPPNARKSKLGKNQYTKDKDIQEAEPKSPGRSQSTDLVKVDDANSSTTKASIPETKPHKSKGHQSKISMLDMRRRVSVMLDFISRTQVEMAAGAISGIHEEEAESLIRGIAGTLPMIKLNGDKGERSTHNDDRVEVKEFNDMTCLEMMDVLTTQLVKWQKEFT